MFYEVVGQEINLSFALRSLKSKLTATQKKNQRSRHLKKDTF